MANKKKNKEGQGGQTVRAVPPARALHTVPNDTQAWEQRTGEQVSLNNRTLELRSEAATKG